VIGAAAMAVHGVARWTNDKNDLWQNYAAVAAAAYAEL
jgi:hypothetical protein